MFLFFSKIVFEVRALSARNCSPILIALDTVENARKLIFATEITIYRISITSKFLSITFYPAFKTNKILL